MAAPISEGIKNLPLLDYRPLDTSLPGGRYDKKLLGDSMIRKLLTAAIFTLCGTGAFAQLFSNGSELSSLSDFKDGKFQFHYEK